jgi:hypothetical protein
MLWSRALYVLSYCILTAYPKASLLRSEPPNHGFRCEEASRPLIDAGLRIYPESMRLASLAGVQDFVVSQQARQELEQRRACPRCRRRYTTKDSGGTSVSTVFGRIEVPNPRSNRRGCQTEGPPTFRPMRTWLNGQNQQRHSTMSPIQG